MKKTPTKYRCVGCRPVAGQSRFVAMKRTALDGLVWWCIFDQKRRRYLEGYKFRLRQECERTISFEVQKWYQKRAGWIPFEPDNEGDKR